MSRTIRAERSQEERETTNRIAALVLGYTHQDARLTNAVLQRQAAEHKALSEHDYEALECIEEQVY